MEASATAASDGGCVPVHLRYVHVERSVSSVYSGLIVPSFPICDGLSYAGECDDHRDVYVWKEFPGT